MSSSPAMSRRSTSGVEQLPPMPSQPVQKQPEPIHVAADVHTKPLDPAYVGETCKVCGAQAETIWGERFYCMEHGWQEWERFGEAFRTMRGAVA